MKLIRKLVRHTLSILVQQKKVRILVGVFLIFFIRRRRASGRESLLIPFLRHQNQVNLLAIGAEGFRGDLEALASVKDFRILTVNRPAQYFLLNRFYSRQLRGQPGVVEQHYHSKEGCGSSLGKAKRAYQEFLSAFLPLLYATVSVDAVLLYNVRYLPDLDWAEVSKSIGAGYFVIFREALIVSKFDF